MTLTANMESAAISATSEATAAVTSEIHTLTTRVHDFEAAVGAWNTLYIYGSALTAALAAFVVLSQYRTIAKGRQLAAAQTALIAAKDRKLALDLGQKDVEISAANERANVANERAGAANQKAESLRQENLKMGMALLPRRLILGDLGPWLEELAKQPPKRALIEVVPDWEAEILASDIRGVLRQFGHWEVQDISNVPVGLIDEGVSLVTLDEDLSAKHEIKMSPSLKALFDLLEHALGPPRTQKFVGVNWRPTNVWFSKMRLGDFVMPPDDVVILVGARPLSLAFPMVGPDTPPITPAK